VPRRIVSLTSRGTSYSLGERSWKFSPDCSGYAVEHGGTAFERKAGLNLLQALLFRFKKNLYSCHDWNLINQVLVRVGE